MYPAAFNSLSSRDLWVVSVSAIRKRGIEGRTYQYSRESRQAEECRSAGVCVWPTPPPCPPPSRGRDVLHSLPPPPPPPRPPALPPPRPPDQPPPPPPLS